MQSIRLYVLTLCFAVFVLLGTSLLAPSSCAQAVLETSQQTNERIRSLSAFSRSLPHDYIIGLGDVLDIDIFDVKELSRTVRVSATGSIGLPLIPARLSVAGLTELQVEQKIAELLEANGLVSHAEVSVSVKERKSKPITVVGAVSHPLVYQAERPVTVLEVLAEAGGISNDAGDTVIITRHASEISTDSSEPPAIGPESPTSSQLQTNSVSNSTAGTPVPASPPSTDAPSNGLPRPSNTITLSLNELMEAGDTTNNILLEAGDVITVPHAGIVYVLGAVAKPGGFVLANDRSQMSTLKILALAGGMNPTAKSDHAVIIRKDDQGKQHEVTVDLRKVEKREVEDVLLQPSDILYVPNSASKQALLRAAELGLAVGSAVAIFRIAYH